MEIQPILHAAFQVLGVLLTGAGFLVPCVTTICEIKREGSVGQRSSVQYAMGLINCVLWITYALSPMGNPFIFWINVFGAGCMLYCLWKFLEHCDQEQLQWGLVCPAAGCISLLCIIVLYGSDRERNKLFLCWVCALSRCLVALVPLINLGMVRQPRQLAYMHLFIQAGISFVNSTVWAVFACTGHKMDHFLFWASLVGMGSSVLQVALLIDLRQKGQPHQPLLAEEGQLHQPLLAEEVEGPAA